MNVDRSDAGAGPIAGVEVVDGGDCCGDEQLSDPDLLARHDVDFSPIVSTATGSIVGVDAQPRSGEIVELSLQAWRLVLLSSLMASVRWRQRSPSKQTLFVNVTVGRRQLEGVDFDRSVRSAIAASGIDPARVVLVLSDEALLHADESQLVSLIRLEESRIHLSAAGPFATIHASRHYDVLRFEQVRIPMHNGSADADTHRMVARTHALGLAIVATNVTTERDLDDARRFGAVQSLGPLHSTDRSITAGPVA